MATAILDYMVDYKDIVKANKELVGLKKTTSTVIKTNEKLGASYNDSVKDVVKLRKEIQKVAAESKQISDIKINVSGGLSTSNGRGKEITDSLERIRTSTSSLGDQFNSIGGQLNGMSGGMSSLIDVMTLLNTNITRDALAFNGYRSALYDGDIATRRMTNSTKKNTDANQDNTKSLEGNIKALASKYSRVLTISAAVVGYSASVTQLTLDNQRLASSINMSYEELQSWQNIAMTVGIQNENAADQIRDWNLKVAEAATGAGEMVAILEDYENALSGVDKSQLYGTQGIVTLTKALKDANVPAEEIRSVLDRMASDLDKLYPAILSATNGINSLNYELSDLDISKLSGMSQSFDIMKDNIIDVSASIVADFAPVVWQVFDAFSAVFQTVGFLNDQLGVTTRIGGALGLVFGTVADLITGVSKGIEYVILGVERMFLNIEIKAMELLDNDFIASLFGYENISSGKSGAELKLQGVIDKMAEVGKEGDALAAKMIANFSGNLMSVITGEAGASSYDIKLPDRTQQSSSSVDDDDDDDDSLAKNKEWLTVLQQQAAHTDALAKARMNLNMVSGALSIAEDTLATTYVYGAAGELEQVNEAISLFEKKTDMMLEYNDEYQNLIIAQGELEKKVSDEAAAHKMSVFNNNLSMLAGALEQDSAAYKAIATTQAISDTYGGANAALNPAPGSPDAALGTTAKMINAGIIVSTGLANVANILTAANGASMVGYAGGTSFVNGSGTSKSDSVPAMLSKGESVLTASASQELGRNNIDAMNRGMTMDSGGGSQSIRGGDIIIQGNVDDETINQLSVMQQKQVKDIAKSVSMKQLKQQKRPGGLNR